MTFVDRILKSIIKFDFIKFELRGEIPEEEEKSPFPFFGGPRNLTQGEIEMALAASVYDDGIKGVFLVISDLRIGLGRANAIRKSITALRGAGKKAYVYIESGGNVEYLIATAAEKIFLPPWAMLNLIGLNAEVTFFRDSLDKLGINAQMTGFGKYKSAAETFTRDSMSAPHREMMDSIIGDLGAQLEEAISKGRGMEPADVKKLIDSGPFVSEWALDAGLIDGIAYGDEIENLIDEETGAKIRSVGARKFIRILKTKETVSSLMGIVTGKPGVISVVSDTGIVTLGDSRGSGNMKTMGSHSLLNLIERVSKEKNVRALVLRILTPGGSGIASDLIRERIKLISEKMPVIVSMSDVAASGGYLIALGASKIVADPMTLTGSIGIVSGKFNLEGFYGKLGVTKEWISHGKHSDMFTFSKGFSEEEQERLEEIMGHYYEGFVKSVSDARGMDRAHAENVAKGRVWTGRQAKELGLVDELGGLWDAVELARKEGGLTDEAPPVVKFFSEERGIKLSTLFKGASGLETLAEFIDGLSSMASEKVLAIMPFRIDLK